MIFEVIELVTETGEVVWADVAVAETGGKGADAGQRMGVVPLEEISPVWY